MHRHSDIFVADCTYLPTNLENQTRTDKPVFNVPRTFPSFKSLQLLPGVYQRFSSFLRDHPSITYIFLLQITYHLALVLRVSIIETTYYQTSYRCSSNFLYYSTTNKLRIEFRSYQKIHFHYSNYNSN